MAYQHTYSPKTRLWSNRSWFMWEFLYPQCTVILANGILSITLPLGSPPSTDLTSLNRPLQGRWTCKKTQVLWIQVRPFFFRSRVLGTYKSGRTLKNCPSFSVTEIPRSISHFKTTTKTPICMTNTISKIVLMPLTVTSPILPLKVKYFYWLL